MRLAVAAFAALLASAVPAAALLAQEPPRPSDTQLAAAEAHTIKLTIRTRSGRARFRVEVAGTSAMQELGLMYRHHMGAHHGMIFPREPASPASFWMKNTLIPLDLVFIRADHTISSIAADAPVRSLATINSTEPVAAVLELNGGAAARYHIRPGDMVRW